MTLTLDTESLPSPMSHGSMDSDCFSPMGGGMDSITSPKGPPPPAPLYPAPVVVTTPGLPPAPALPPGVPEPPRTPPARASTPLLSVPKPPSLPPQLAATAAAAGLWRQASAAVPPMSLSSAPVSWSADATTVLASSSGPATSAIALLQPGHGGWAPRSGYLPDASQRQHRGMSMGDAAGRAVPPPEAFLSAGRTHLPEPPMRHEAGVTPPMSLCGADTALLEVTHALSLLHTLSSGPFVPPLPPGGCYGSLHISSVLQDAVGSEAAKVTEAAARELGDRPVKVLLPWYPACPGAFDQRQPAKVPVTAEEETSAA